MAQVVRVLQQFNTKNMQRLIVSCSECESIVSTIEKEKINIQDYYYSPVDVLGNIIAENLCVFKCDCGVYSNPQESDLINITE